MKNKPFKKIYEFGKLTIIHPSGAVDVVTIEQLEFKHGILKSQIADLMTEQNTIEKDLALISSRSRIKRLYIKRNIKNKLKGKDSDKANVKGT